MWKTLNSVKLNGARGWALLIAGIFAITRGVAYLPALSPPPEELPSGLAVLSTLIPIEAWAGIWIIVGIHALIRSFSANDSVAWGFIVGMMVIWGLGFGVGWWYSLRSGDPNREWVSMATYLAFALSISVLTARSTRKSILENG